MTRILLYIVKAALLIGAAVWLAEHPGRIAIDWEGWRIDSNLAVLAVMLAMTLAVMLALYRLWRLMREGAGGWRRRRQAKRLHSGYQAFTQGMIALAAGDTEQARRQAHRTLALADQQPLGLLLRAQAAQIDGDRKEAEAALRAMLDQPSTAFLGLRGLTAMALRDGAEDQALAFAERALALRAQARWAIQTLLDIRIRQGAWPEAWDAIEAAAAARMWDKARLNRRRALILLGQARDAQSRNDARDALIYAEKAVELAIDLVPASLLKAECLLALERPAKAAAAIERIWAKHPHPDLARLYLIASKSQDPLAQVKHCQELLALAPNAAEGHLAMADTARLARLWGEARTHYRAAAADPLTRGRACQGLASVEEADRGDFAKALVWLKDAATAPPAPQWRCHRCGTGRDRWQAHCPACGEIDGLQWTGDGEAVERSQIAGKDWGEPAGKLVY